MVSTSTSRRSAATGTANSASNPAGAALSRDAIVDRALETADQEGIEAVSIRRIAQDFWVTPMALYWHVKNKDELLAAMGDRMLATMTLPADDGRRDLDQLRDLINTGASSDKIRDVALRTGLIPLRNSGLEKVFGGITTIEEVIRETVSDV